MSDPSEPLQPRASHFDDLAEYGGDFRTFETLDHRTAADILRRRAAERPSPLPGEPTKPFRNHATNDTAATNDQIQEMATEPVRVTSSGNTLIVGSDAESVIGCSRRLARHQPCLMVIDETDSQSDSVRLDTKALLRGTDCHIKGGLGGFRATAMIEDRVVQLSRKFPGAPDHFDLVLDLRPAVAGKHDLQPPGYFVAKYGSNDLERIMEILPQMIGTFEKPRFITRNGIRCVGPDACDRCQMVCPVAAVSAVDGLVHIDQAACPGCGLCAVACPTGAIQFCHPFAPDLLSTIQGRIADARLACNSAPIVVFRQAAAEEMFGDSSGENNPASVLTFNLAAIGCVGPEVWLSTLAYGADAVAIQLPQSYPARMRKVIAEQHRWVTALLEGLGHPQQRIRLMNGEADIAQVLHGGYGDVPTTNFPPTQSKSALIRRSAAHLALCGQAPRAIVDLPEGAPLGAVAVDSTACTLCMACVGACPTGALSTPGDELSLKLVESNCIQCGRCRQTCPEQALRLIPRLRWSAAVDEYPQKLFSQDPLACVCCGRPFAPPGLVSKMLERLEGHRLYQREEDRQRLKMCRECRIRELFRPHHKEEP